MISLISKIAYATENVYEGIFTTARRGDSFSSLSSSASLEAAFGAENHDSGETNQ